MRWITGNHETPTGPTVGANHQRKALALDAEEVDLYLWDTAGQEQFQALTPLYAHSASAALVVAAIDDLDSFNGLPTWTDILSQSCDKQPPMVLAVNKIDLDLTKRPCLQRDEIKHRYETGFAGIFYVSAATGEGVEQVFRHIAECAYSFLMQNKRVTSRLRLKSNAREPKTCC
jgi:small GTP-binding protein